MQIFKILRHDDEYYDAMNEFSSVYFPLKQATWPEGC